MSSASRRGLVVPGLLVALAVLVRYGAHFSVDGAIVGHDWYTMHRVDALHVEAAAREGKLLATWSPWILGGSPLWAVPTKPFGYPPFLIAVWTLGASLAMNVLLLAHLFLGGFGTVLLARRMGLAGAAPALCGVLFVLARFPAFGFQSAPYGFGYAVAWWPYTLIALLDLLDGRRGPWAAAFLGIFAALQWHAGGQASLYWLVSFSALFALPWLARRRTQREWASLGARAALAAAVAFGLVAIKLLPELAWVESSGRGAPLGMQFARDSALEDVLLQSGRESRLVNMAAVLVDEYSYGGGVLLALGCLAGILLGRRRRGMWGALLGTAFVFALASGALHEWAYEWLPGYDRMRRHSRFVQMVGFGAILLAGYGLELPMVARWRRSARKEVRAVAVAALPLIALAVLVDTGSLPGVRARGVTLHSASDHLARMTEQLAPVLAEPRIGRLQAPHRSQPVWVELGIEGSGGALGGPKSGNARYHEILEEHAPAARLQRSAPGALDVMNVRYVASPTPLPGSGLELVNEPRDLSPETRAGLLEVGSTPLYLYRRTTPRARVCAVSSPTLVVGTPEARRASVRQTVGSRSFSAREQVLLEGPDPDLLAGGESWTTGVGRVRFAGVERGEPTLERWLEEHPGGVPRASRNAVEWEPPAGASTRVVDLEDERYSRTMTRIEVDVTGVDAPFLLLSDVTTLDGGWTATIDGAPADLLRADGLVTLLRLPPGARRVCLDFTPPGLVRGAWITACTVVVLLASAFAAAAVRWRARRGIPVGLRRPVPID